VTVPLVDLKAQYQAIRGEIDAAIAGVVQSGRFILGTEVKAFEEEMAAYCGTRYAVGVASGTDALHLALLACGIGPGDGVITTPFTFIATAEAIVSCGATPVFVDIDPATCNIDPQKLEQLLKSRSKSQSQSESKSESESHSTAILPVHLYGQPVDMDPILEVAARHGLRVIEDCAQALGAEYKGRKVGSLGIAGCLSFFPSKNLGAYGDGGMVVTNDEEVADAVRMLRVHGSRTTYEHVMHGFNSRLDALQAAVLRVKLRHLDGWNELRRGRGALYDRLLGSMRGIQLLPVAEHCRSSCNYYTVRLTGSSPDRGELRKHLETKGIGSMVYYPLSLHLQEVYGYLGHKAGDFPESERAQEEVLSLPMYPELGEEEIHDVVQAIGEFVEGSE